MANFFFKLIAPRPTFPADMTPEEGALMQQHVVYWRGWMDKGHVVAFGPVADPTGVFGVAIVQLDEGTNPQAVGAGDPVVAAGIGFSYEIHPMLSLLLPDKRA